MSGEKRQPRYRRVSDVPNIEITERDCAIVRHVAEHRLLTAVQLEADRGNMPNKRLKSYWQNDFYKKLIGYYQLFQSWRQTSIDPPLSFRKFRVLTVTTTPTKVANLVAANKEINGGKGSGIFLFTDSVTLKEADNLLRLPLTNGKGEETTLCD